MEDDFNTKLKKDIADPIQELQEDLLEYFKDMDNNTFAKVVTKLVYHQGDEDTRTSELVLKFLQDNGLEKAYMNYIYNMKQRYMIRDLSDVQMIENVKSALLSLAFNRFRRLV